MARNLRTSIDVGTSTTRVVIAEKEKGSDDFTVVGVGSAPTRGMRHGYVTSPDTVALSIKKAVNEAAKALNGEKIRRAQFLVGAVTLSSASTIGTAVISKADNEVTALDVEKSIKESEAHVDLTNRRVLRIIPQAYRLDGKEIHGTPVGMKGIKLETRVFYVTALTQHMDDLEAAALLAGIDVIDLIPTPFASAETAMTERQKTVGGAVVTIGSDTVSIGVFEDNVPIGVQVFPFGSNDITNDIALAFKISLEEAENIKIGASTNLPKKKVDDVIEARLDDIFELLDNYLKKLKRSELLPAGIVFVGAGALLPSLEIVAKSSLNLPARVGVAEDHGKGGAKVRDPGFLPVYGASMLGIHNPYAFSDGSHKNDSFKEAVKRFFDQFRP